jgi:2-succinyl-5-enolpyruvyl-6-hydroxy-3-cyclohexene-1-carboxylate synthase
MDKIANRNTFWASTLVEELQRAGLQAVVIAPGSRSTPLAIAFSSQPGLSIYVHTDERGAAFFALGMSLATGKPAAVLCTSGTAAVNFYPAVVEAHQSNIPLLVLTADRPSELHDSGSNQTIDQIKLYGSYTRWSVEAPMPETAPAESTVRALSSLASRAMAAAQGIPPGPVHLNFPFRKPLEPLPVPGDIPASFWDEQAGFTHSRHAAAPFTRMTKGRLIPSGEQVKDLTQAIQNAHQGLIYCGPRSPGGEFPRAVYRLAQAAGFPIFTDALSGLRFHVDLPEGLVIGGYETFLNHPEIKKLAAPDLVLQFGSVPTSKSLGDALAHFASARRIQINSQGTWSDDSFQTSDFLWADETAAIQAALENLEPDGIYNPDPQWLSNWQRAEQLSWLAVDQTREEGFFEGALLADVVDVLQPGDSLFVASSLPVRHLDQFGRPNRKALNVYANRGASGIDGTIASALGVAEANSPDRLVLVTGDLAFLHDLNSLLLLHKYSMNVKIVLVNNDGGGIFRRLPVAGFEPPFTELFVVPHGLKFEGAADLFQLDYQELDGGSDFRRVLEEALQNSRPQIIEVHTDSAAHEQARRRLTQNFQKLWETASTSLSLQKQMGD